MDVPSGTLLGNDINQNLINELLNLIPTSSQIVGGTLSVPQIKKSNFPVNESSVAKITTPITEPQIASSFCQH